MGRKLIATILLLLPVGHTVARAGPLIAGAPHQCRCNERICRCTHEHKKPTVPKCHLADGSSLPSLKSCDSSAPQALALGCCMLSPRVTLSQPLPVAPLTATTTALPADFSPELDPPPPRSSFA